MTIGKEFQGKRANIESVAAMDRQLQEKKDSIELRTYHLQTIKRLNTLEGRVFKNSLFKDFEVLHKKSVEVLAGKYHKKEDNIGIDKIYYLMIEGTGKYDGVFSDGLVIEGVIRSDIVSAKGKRVEYLNDGFGERSYEVRLSPLKRKLFSKKKLELGIPIEDGIKDKTGTRQRGIMTKTKKGISLGWLGSELEYFEGEIKQIDKYGGVKITLAEVLAGDVMTNIESWQEDKKDLVIETDPKEIKFYKQEGNYKEVLEDIEFSLRTLGRLQFEIRGEEISKIIKEAVDLARQRSTIGLPVGNEV